MGIETMKREEWKHAHREVQANISNANADEVFRCKAALELAFFKIFRGLEEGLCAFVGK